MSGYRHEDIKKLYQKEKTKKRFGPEEDPERIAEAQAILAQQKKLMEQMTWRQFEAKISEIGAIRGTEQHRQFRSLYREYRQDLEQRERQSLRKP